MGLAVVTITAGELEAIRKAAKEAAKDAPPPPAAAVDLVRRLGIGRYRPVEEES